MSGMTMADIRAEVRAVCERILGPKDEANGRWPDVKDSGPEFEELVQFGKDMHHMVGCYFPKYRAWFEQSERGAMIHRMLREVEGWQRGAKEDSERLLFSVLLGKLWSIEEEVSRG